MTMLDSEPAGNRRPLLEDRQLFDRLLHGRSIVLAYDICQTQFVSELSGSHESAETWIRGEDHTVYPFTATLILHPCYRARCFVRP
jgi:hypothetical protein